MKWIKYMAAVCVLFAVMLVTGSRAEAALEVSSIDYEKSTITIKTTSGDTILYFSDKNKTKWEMATEQFANNLCTMDISWVSTTKNYELTFKGDKTNKSAEILSVTLPKQDTKFKAKYNSKTKKVTFTNQGSRTVEYRKNNTENWTDFPTTDNGWTDMMDRLSENGASIYFRLKAENGTSASAAGNRPSKESTCKIGKKTAAPTVTIDTNTLSIAVQSGWEVRKVNITEKSGVQYASSLGTWQSYNASKDVPLTEVAPEAMYTDVNEAGTKNDVYLQFRKSATSTTQMSYITTIKVPAQKQTPDVHDAGVTIEYTSPTTFKLTIAAASSLSQYEYCIVDKSDMKGDAITDIDSVTWKAVSSATAVEIKQKEAPEGSCIFYRKKTFGKMGDDDFALATPYRKFDTVSYTGLSTSGLNVDKYLFDGVCVTGNSAGNITFTYHSPFNSKITAIGLSTTPSPTGAGDCTTTLTSTVTANNASTSDSDKYIVTATITNIKLSNAVTEQLENAGTTGVTLYAYITLSSGEPISSANDQGLRIHMVKQSKIEAENTNSKLSITRFVGYNGADSAYQSFSFLLKMGYAYGTNLEKYGSGNMSISSVQLGNYTLTENTDYTYDSSNNKFTVHLSTFETDEKLVPYYGTTQTLTIKLTNGEILKDVSIKLEAPVSLKDTYSWAFTNGQLVTEKTTTKTDTSGTVTTTEPVNSYTVEYKMSSASSETKSSDKLTVDSCTFKSATLGGYNILSSTGTGNIVFSNALLNALQSSGNVQITFEVRYSNGTSQDYTITKGCYFSII